jgi:hypothetical protein
MAPLLAERLDNQDIYQMMWGGFAVYLLHVPNPNEHCLALSSLRYDMAQFKEQGYERKNLLSHSWGTVLCKDYILCSDEPNCIGLWATMGSPLPDVASWWGTPGGNVGNGVSSIYAFVDEWKNFYCLIDPVVYLRIFGPRASDVKPFASPLFMTSGIEQCRINSDSLLGAHSSYWAHPDVIKSICLSLGRQP